MSDWKEFFKGKRVTIMGLGLLGRGLGDAIFLAEHGAELIVTDLRDEKTLASSISKLQNLKTSKSIRFVLGGHRLGDFRNRDFILKAAGVPLDSPFIAEALENNVPVEMDASLFAKLMPEGVILVGVTGTRGKSTTTALIYDILKAAGKKVYKGGNLVPEATLPLVAKVKAGDIVVLELDSWQLQGFRDAKISPRVAVFTNFLNDHMLYYKGDTAAYFEDKEAIFRFQKKGDTLVVGEQAAARVSEARPPAVPVVVGGADILPSWKLQIPGEHNRENAAAAAAAAKALGVADAVIKKALEAFRGVPGRLQYLRTVGGVSIYNDNNATTPDATLAALKALARNPKSQAPNHKQISKSQNIQISKSDPKKPKKIVLILGGTDKGLDMSKLAEEIPKHCKAAVFLKETGTEKLISNFLRHGGPISNQFSIFQKETLKECLEEAMKLAKKGDIILFSPAFASFGKWFKNEYDRGAQFVELAQQIKNSR